MQTYPVPFNEAARLDALAALNAKYRDEPDPVLDAVTEMARALTGAESALVSLVEADRQVFVSRCRFPVGETPRDLSICAHVVMGEAPLIVPDTHESPIFADHPVVTGPPHVRFYVGAPIRLSSGLVMGSLCGLGFAPAPAPPREAVDRLAELATLVARVLEERAVRAGRSPSLERAADRAQEEFLALVGHELRTPLQGILGATELMEPAPGSEDFLAVLRTSGDLMERLVERLVGFADLRAGRVMPCEAEVELGDLVDLVAVTLGPLLAAAGRGRPEVDAEPGIRMRGDPDMLALAMECLATNALVHGEGRMRLTMRRCAEGVRIAVEDDGPGIAPHLREAVRAPFAVGAPVTARRADGIGLGLPLTRRLVELHAGAMSLEGGEGEPFRAAITLPCWRLAA